MRKLSATEVDALLRRGTDVVLLDVREPWECERASLPRARRIPMRQLPLRLKELDCAATTVVMCHHGTRSSYAAEWLEEQGFADVVNLEGGIDAWAENVDPSVGRY